MTHPSTSSGAGEAPRLTGASQPATPVSFTVPRGTCDCLTHVFGDPAQYPMSPTRTYTPELASLAELRAAHAALQVDRAVLVQTTVYGTDNSCMLDSLRAIGPSARGIAVIDNTFSQWALDEMHQAGVRGIRINLETVGITDPDVAERRFENAVSLLRHRAGWHIQMFVRLSVVESVHHLIAAAPVPVSLDHFGGTSAATSLHEPGFDVLLDLLRAGKVYTRLSAPELVSTQGPDYPDIPPLAKKLIDANPERIIWASHWPHPDSDRGAQKKRLPTEVTPLRKIDDGHAFNLLPVWAPDAGVRHGILVDNPARLFGYGPVS